MTNRLQDKVAIITGAASGIGLGTLEVFVREGARVVAADIQDAKGLLLEQRFPGRVVYQRCDVLKEADISAAISLAESRFGGLDILFNNAGHAGADQGVEAIDGVDWDATFAVLVRSVAFGMKHAAPAMKRRGGGSIVNTASIAGLMGGCGPLAYSAAKAAVIQLTKLAAAELSPQGVRVNAICPGLIATPIFGAAMGLDPAVADQMAARIAKAAGSFQPVREAGAPAHVGEAVLFLASDAAAFVSGAALVVDGGYTIGAPDMWGVSLNEMLAADPAQVVGREHAKTVAD